MKNIILQKEDRNLKNMDLHITYLYSYVILNIHFHFRLHFNFNAVISIYSMIYTLRLVGCINVPLISNDIIMGAVHCIHIHHYVS